MKCIECKKFMTMGNTDETGMGICSFPVFYFPVNANDECVYALQPYTCSDCLRCGGDFACFTCKAEDSAYHGDDLCGGFMDKKEATVEGAIKEWLIRGLDVFEVKEKLDNILDNIDLEELPTEENLRKDNE